MNREMLLRILTVAVVAPYLIKLSGKEKGYFGTGLKLVAGSLIAVNVVPLLKDFETVKAQMKTFMTQVAAAQATLEKTARQPVTVDADDIDDAEFS